MNEPVLGTKRFLHAGILEQHCYRQPTMLKGYHFSAEKIRAAQARERLLSMRLETSARCNLQCVYCNGYSGKKLPGEIGVQTILRVISEAKDLGAESIVVIGGGEPTVYPAFRNVISFIAKLGLIPVVITNATKLDREMVRFLFDQNASILMKLDSLREKTQDFLAGKKGTFKRIMNGIEEIRSSGFCRAEDGSLRCGISFVVTRYNIDDILDLWAFCRENNFCPNLEEFIPRGRGAEFVDDLWVDRQRVACLKQKLLQRDRSCYQYDWLVYSPLPGHGCLQLLYSVYVSSQGFVQPCADIAVRLFNIKEMPLSKILKTDFFQFVRNIRDFLRGKCSACEHTDTCIGCRGLAFTVGKQEGLNTVEALCREDPLCCKP